MVKDSSRLGHYSAYLSSGPTGKKVFSWLLSLILLSVFFVVFTTPASAVDTVPTKMNFQGRLTDSSGNIKANGTYNMRFKLYTVASGGTNVWSEDRLVAATQGVTVTNGTFSVQLGSITTLPASLFASGALYLEVELPTPASATTSSPVWTETPMTPRNQMATSAYAYNAETLDGIDGASFAQKGTTNTFTAAQTVNVSSTGAFDIQNGSAVSVFKVNTSGASVTIGTSDTTGTIFVLDTKTDGTDPTGSNGGMYYNSNFGKFRCYENFSWVNCIGAGTGGNVFTGSQTINVASTAALDVQNGSAVSVFKVDSSTSTVTIGTATNGSVFTSTGVSYNGTARPTKKITLAPEYAGGTFTADGSNNNGSLSSDFCSSSSLLNTNTTACPSAADEYNYYAWTTTQGTAQDYDIHVRYQVPSDYDTGSMTNLRFTAMGTLGANEIASLAMYKGNATACGTITDAITSNATWATSTNASPLGACTIAAGDMVTFKIKLTAVSNGFARAGNISFDYRSKF